MAAMSRKERSFSCSPRPTALNVAPIPSISVTPAQTKIRRELLARCQIADEWREIALMIKTKFISKLALTLAAGCLSVWMLGPG
jgi:hypothetical protein